MAFRITNATAQAPDTISVFFSDDADQAGVTTAANYTVRTVDPSLPSGNFVIDSITYNQAQKASTIFLNTDSGDSLQQGQWIEVQVANVKPAGGGGAITDGGTGNNTFYAHVNGNGDPIGKIAQSTDSIATSVGRAGRAVQDLADFSMLTEEIGYPPSPLAVPSGGGVAAPAAGVALGQVAAKAISDVLGWKLKTDDPKAFVGALNASFTCKEVEGHTECAWVPRTYAVQTDLSGGITGAQASIYSRAKDALDQSLPLLDGLYPLFEEASLEDVAALRATVRSQMADLVSELGLLGGPRITRVNQFFFLLLGQQLPSTTPIPSGFSLVTDPDSIDGSLGNLRDEFGFSEEDDLVNTVEDEQNLTNYRIISDYMTSLAQTWINNLQFFGLSPTATPFFGTQLVLISRQLSVVAESVNEVRFTLDSVFIGPAQRQTLEIDFRPDPVTGQTPPAMFLEDLLSWAYGFASDEGPRLIQDGGKFAVGESFGPIANQLQSLVQGARNPQNILGLPRGYRTGRVSEALRKLAEQLGELVSLAAPIKHVITPEPEPLLPLAISSVNPSGGSKGTSLTVQIAGTGFEAVATSSFGAGITANTFFSSQGRLVAKLTIAATALTGPRDVTVTNPDGGTATLPGGFTVTA